MSARLSVEDARAVLGDAVLGPDELTSLFGPIPDENARLPIPFVREELTAARQAGEMLILRVSHRRDNVPVTMMQLIASFPQSFDQKPLRQMGYQLKDEWGIELEPLAGVETCAPGWAL